MTKAAKNMATRLLYGSAFFVAFVLQLCLCSQIILSDVESRHDAILSRATRQANANDDVYKSAFATKLNSSHLHMMVHWAGQGSPVLFILSRSIDMDSRATSKTFLSTDYGKSFQDISARLKLENGQNAVVAKYYNHPQSICHYVFADVVNRYLFTTSNCGESFAYHKLDTIHPSLIVFDKNRDTTFLVHDLESPEKRLYVTKNFGETFDVVQDYVRNFLFHYGADETRLYVERIHLMANETNDLRVTVLSSTNFFEKHIDTELVYRSAVQFQLLGDYLFVTRYRNESSKDHLDLFISHHGERFVMAKFPFSEDKNMTHLEYHIIDVTDDGQIMIVVNHGPVLSNLYISTKVTRYEVDFALSLENVMFYNPNVTWHESWLAGSVGDKPFADVYKIQGLRGIYVASQIIDPTQSLRTIQPKDLRSLITFDQGSIWTPIKGPKQDEKGNEFSECQELDGYRCNLHLSQQLSMKFPSTRSIPILSSKSAVGIVVASGNMGRSLLHKTDVFVSADAGLSWHQVLKGSYYFNVGDHGGILVAVKYYKTQGPTNELLFSTNEGLDWKSIKFYKEPFKVFGLLTEPGENTTTFTVFGMVNEPRAAGNNSTGPLVSNWVVVTVDLQSEFARNCSDADYKRWSPNDSSMGKHRNCLLGRKEIYERRMVHANCYNGRDYERLLGVENCECEKSDYQCDFGFRHDDSWSDGCIQDENYHHDPYAVPASCRSGSYFNMTRGYVKIPGDTCEGGNAKLFEPHVVACPIREEKEFLLMSKRSAIIRVNLRNFSDYEALPVENVTNVISLEYDMDDGCIFYGDTTARKIFKQCLNGSRAEVLVANTETVEGMSYDWISKTLYYVDGSRQTIEVVRVDVKNDGRMRKTILDGKSLGKPRGIAVHPLHGQLFYSDWNEKNPHIGSASMDGSSIKILQRGPVVQWPNGLALDYVANRLYWTDAKKDAISSCRFDGSDYKIVIERSLQLAHPFGVAIHKNLMFWDDWTHHGLFMADKNTGRGSSMVLGSISGAMDVKAFSFLHRQGQNGCSNSPCSHICIPMPNDAYKCACPDGLRAVTSSTGVFECKCPDGSDQFHNGTCPEQGGSCSPEQFTCTSGLCIPSGWVCNGNNDCGDNSDELDSRCSPLVCRESEFMCADREKCIPDKWKCDYDNDCRDGSDEQGCTSASCAPDQFRCSNGQCINQKWLCDLENDCQDGSDEDNCRERAGQAQGCNASEFKCNNNTQQCLPNSWKCDGDFDCPGQEDEQNCDGTTCQEWQFDCGKGHCVFATWKCDGDVDCPNGADEANCTATQSPDDDSLVNPFPILNVTHCSEWTFRCNNGQCVPYWWKCDGSKDCSDNSDELECGTSSLPKENDYDSEEDDPTWLPKCAEDKFLCPKTGDCIWEAWLCDGENDCPGGEDEAAEVCANRPTCTKDMFRCEKSGQCIPYEHICNSIVDCPDGSDELACQDEGHVFPLSRCKANEFPCDESICIPDSKMCDGINDCVDATDELGCAPNHPQVLGLAVVGDRINATSVKVDWYVPDIAHAKDYDFQPSYAPEGTDEWTFLGWLKRPDMTYTFTGLRPFTTYKFRVNLRTESNIVYNTTTYVKTTTSPAMPSRPSLYEANHTEDSSIVLSWTKPSSTNGPLKNYIVEMSLNGSSAKTWETDGPALTYVLDASEFTPGQKLTFRVRAVNSLFNGEWSTPLDVVIGHSIIEERIGSMRVEDRGESWVFLKWSKVEPSPSSILYNDATWSYRVSYAISNNQFAEYEDLNISNSETQVNVTGLSPGSPYMFRFNVQKDSMAGPVVLSHITTPGKPLPKPTISEAKVTPSSGTSVKLSWTLPLDVKESDWTYAIFYGVSLAEMVGQGRRKTTKETTVTLSGLHACESYSFVVAIVGPRGFGPPSAPYSENTKFAAGAPPKSLQARLDKSSNNITITWKASCSVIDDPIDYTITVKDLVLGRTSYIRITRTADTSLSHFFSDAKYGTEYAISVQTGVANALASNEVRVKTRPIPVPEGLAAFLDVNASKHDITWKPPQSSAMPSYLLDQVRDNKVTYRLLLSKNARMSNPELSINLTSTSYMLPEEQLEPGQIYYVSVCLLDKDGYVSEMAGPVAIEPMVPATDLVVSPTSVAGVLVPIFIVILLMGGALAIYVQRNRKMSRRFAAFASRYSPATGASILSTGALDDDDDESPIIRGFADDEPLVIS